MLVGLASNPWTLTLILLPTVHNHLDLYFQVVDGVWHDYKTFKLIEYFCFSLCSGFENMSTYFLFLITTEERSNVSIIITVSSNTHAGYQAMTLTETISFITVVLREGIQNSVTTKYPARHPEDL